MFLVIVIFIYRFLPFGLGFAIGWGRMEVLPDFVEGEEESGGGGYAQG
jgi:hypothetical protein